MVQNSNNRSGSAPVDLGFNCLGGVLWDFA